jgi:LysM repeat protein
MLDGKQVEVKAQISLEAIVFREMTVQCLATVQEEPLDLVELQERPGMVGYVGRPGERIWDIAKENFTTVSEIQERNQLSSDTLKGGEKLLIVKQVG